MISISQSWWCMAAGCWLARVRVTEADSDLHWFIITAVAWPRLWRRARQLTVSPSFLVPEKAVIQCSEIAAIVVIIVIRHIDSILYSKHYLWVLDGIKRKHKVWFKIPASKPRESDMHKCWAYRTFYKFRLLQVSSLSSFNKECIRTKQIIVISKKCRK